MENNNLSDRSQFRAVQLTINNPKEKGFDHQKIKDTLNHMKPTVYYCLADEIGGREKTYHTHIYVLFSTPVSFKTIKNRFPEAHIERTRGTRKENIDYIKKSGIWASTDKSDTCVEGTFEEVGTLPTESAGSDILLNRLYQLVQDGYTDVELMAINTDFCSMLNIAQKIRLEFLNAKFKGNRRLDITVIYLFGKCGSGKTRYVLDLYGDSNVYRVTDYKNPFDSYAGEDVLCLDEFNSNNKYTIEINELNNLCDIYPLELRSRYQNKVACYTKVYIISNLDIDEQYKDVQRQAPELWNAFTRRITRIMYFTDVGVWIEYDSYADYLKSKENPFDN